MLPITDQSLPPGYLRRRARNLVLLRLRALCGEALPACGLPSARVDVYEVGDDVEVAIIVPDEHRQELANLTAALWRALAALVRLVGQANGIPCALVLVEPARSTWIPDVPALACRVQVSVHRSSARRCP